MGHAEPNAGHRAMARLDPDLLITQNVDGLHEAAGSRQVVALHGRVSEVVCLGCRQVTPRAALQERLAELNAGWLAEHASAAMRPDGDVELEETDGFVVPGCDACGGAAQAARGLLRRERARPSGWPAATPRSRPSARTASCWSPARR